MRKSFVFVRENRTDAAWAARFVAGRAAARTWYLGEKAAPAPSAGALEWHRGGGRGAPPSAAECRDALSSQMPELLAAYDRACNLIDADALDRCVLSHYRPAPESAACTLAVWHGPDGPALIRQQDFPLDKVSERFEMTDWAGRRVIGKAQRPWGGLHDGMNESGLVVASTFGGAPAQGLGFSIILITRYLLETCSRVAEALEALRRIPVALSHNVMLLDRTGEHATVYIGPNREPAITRECATTNHQEAVVWPELAASSNTVARLKAAREALAEPGMTLATLTARFLERPIYSRSARAPTVYTAVYRPADGRIDFVWPGRTLEQRFDDFRQVAYTHDYAPLR